MKMLRTPPGERTYKFKRPTLDFFCPLCRTPRSLTYSAKLSIKQYWQVAFLSAVLILLTYEIMSVRVFIWPFIVWGIYEGVNKLLFREQVQCPHCGFDATWYKRDVRVARSLVEDFWQDQSHQEIPPVKESSSTAQSEL